MKYIVFYTEHDFDDAYNGDNPTGASVIVWPNNPCIHPLSEDEGYNIRYTGTAVEECARLYKELMGYELSDEFIQDVADEMK